eukprot:CAMPEP_0176213554 /NCGR_PEP_ID=MMETSP0121_2-20121125/15718_1 /TAXON_ID=160619 /ORGANISM="Kryptoperidinium foliaceum, Strain CCMP 1326" /LENGTH=287 /DNA_ID=CAMNT_0017552619 /DNA_START=186 /DNA_END=1047 /DNA_ORIENTATION=+
MALLACFARATSLWGPGVRSQALRPGVALCRVVVLDLVLDRVAELLEDAHRLRVLRATREPRPVLLGHVGPLPLHRLLAPARGVEAALVDDFREQDDDDDEDEQAHDCGMHGAARADHPHEHRESTVQATEDGAENGVADRVRVRDEELDCVLVAEGVHIAEVDHALQHGRHAVQHRKAAMQVVCGLHVVQGILRVVGQDEAVNDRVDLEHCRGDGEQQRGGHRQVRPDIPGAVPDGFQLTELHHVQAHLRDLPPEKPLQDEHQRDEVSGTTYHVSDFGTQYNMPMA